MSDRGYARIFGKDSVQGVYYLVSVLLCAAVCMINDYNLSQYYGAPYLKAPVQSLTFMKDIVLRVSVRQWMFLVIAVKCILSAVVSAAAYAVSAALLGNRR